MAVRLTAAILVGDTGAWDPVLNSLAQTLASFNWSKVAEDLAETQRCSWPQVEAWIKELCRFLLLKVIENDIHGTKLAPSDPVNAAWHALLLYPADYLALCSSLLQVKGTVLDHNPRARFDSLRPERYAVTLDKYQSVFATDASKPFWHTLEHIRFQCTQIAFSVPNAQPPQSSSACNSSVHDPLSGSPPLSTSLTRLVPTDKISTPIMREPSYKTMSQLPPSVCAPTPQADIVGKDTASTSDSSEARGGFSLAGVSTSSDLDPSNRGPRKRSPDQSQRAESMSGKVTAPRTARRPGVLRAGASERAQHPTSTPTVAASCTAVAAVSSAPIKPPQAAVACDVTARVVAPATSACNIGKSKSGPDVASATPHRTSTPLPTTARRSAGPGTSRPVIPLVVPRYLTTIGQVPDSPPCKKARTGGATPSPDEDAGDLESVPSDTREVTRIHPKMAGSKADAPSSCGAPAVPNEEVVNIKIIDEHLQVQGRLIFHCTVELIKSLKMCLC